MKAGFGEDEPRVLVWFSNGAASAVALHESLKIYGDRVVGVYCNTLVDEHPDNARFFSDVEKWLDIDIEVIASDKYTSIEDVAEKTRYMAGVQGARCTVELKKVPRFKFERPDDVHVFGFTADEKDRADFFEENNPELTVAWPLIDADITKEDCYKIINFEGIKLPELYLLGYPNNNCIGCFKATSAAYWNRIRVDFPDVFERRAEQSRRLKVRLTRYKGERIFLDDLPADYMKGWKIREDLSCGVLCGLQLGLFK